MTAQTPDPTRIRNQPSLTTSSGRIWLTVGAVFALITIAVLVPMMGMQPPGVALVGICTIVALYAAMVIARLLVRNQRLRLAIMAGCMLVMALTALACTYLIASEAWLLTTRV